jgi:hypothetical protein
VGVFNYKDIYCEMKELIRHILREQVTDKITKPGLVYKITFINGKIYIGQNTERNLKFRDPFYVGSFNKEYVYEDLSNSGWDGTSFPVISKEILWQSDNTTINEVTKKEIEYIKQYKSTNPQIGYNQNRFKSY